MDADLEPITSITITSGSLQCEKAIQAVRSLGHNNVEDSGGYGQIPI